LFQAKDMQNSDFPSPEDLGAALNPRALYLMIYPTEKCNFLCAYCYEDHKLGSMSPEVLRGLKRLIERRMGYLKHIRLSWFGGEPLLAKDVMFEFAEFVEQRCAESGCIHLPGSVTTNGFFLSVDIVERLIAARQTQFHISLDGIGDAHDRSRPLASGGGSFQQIWANLEALRRSSLEFELVFRVHYGFPAAEATNALCRRLNSVFGGDRRFRVTLQAIADLGGENTGKITPLSTQEALNAAQGFSVLMPDLPVSDNKAADFVICEAARPNNLLIRPDGRVCKCAVNMNDPRNEVGRLGENGHIEFDQTRLQAWFRGYENLDKDILLCPFTWVREAPVGSE
jgi:uncharacterized protein